MAIKGKFPRIILYSGKGGVGKTTISAATGVRCAEMGYRTLVLSIDVAHSLSDSFDRTDGLLEHNRGNPVQVAERLWIQEIDVQEDVERYWGQVYQYIATLLNTSGLDEIVAEELAILPGMEEVCALLYVNEYIQTNAYDVLILDCAPTGESLRFISIPSTLDWYMRKIFKIERRVAQVAGPMVQRLTDIPIPGKEYFRGVQLLYDRLEGVDRVLMDREQTTVRLVTNAEKMVVAETQRAFLYFCLYGMTIDCVVVNRLLSEEAGRGFFGKWKETQDRYMEEIQDIFSPVPIRTVNLFEDEVMGRDRLLKLASGTYAEEDPTLVLFSEQPYEFAKEEGGYTVKIRLPFADKKDVEVYKKSDQLILRIGGFKRHVALPRNLRRYKPGRAKFHGDTLHVRMEDRE